jgi:hypothetical protein
VTFNSYLNNPVVGDERQFFAVRDAQHKLVNDQLRVTRSERLTFRISIDNDTYQSLTGKKVTAALRTHIHVVFPKAPRYEVFTTAYLSAANAQPRSVWSTVRLYASRPMQFSVVRGSATLIRASP